MPQLEQTVVDLVRAGMTSDVAGVRQLARAAMKKVPPEVRDEENFRRAVGEALIEQAPFPTTLLRKVNSASMPTDEDTGSPLVVLEGNMGVDPVLPPAAADRIKEVLREWQCREELVEAGLVPTHKLLITGPPGVGKTMTAAYMARSLNLPLISIDLATVMSSFLGRTGRNLRSALDYGRESQCVVLLDEFDSLAKRRDDDSDVGELKRLVNVLLMELERWPTSSFLIAATNHPQLLDTAISRRFDAIIEIDLPAFDGRMKILEQAFARFSLAPGISALVAECTEGFSGSQLTSLAEQASKRAVIGKGEIGKEIIRLMLALSPREGVAFGQLCKAARSYLGLSDRKIAEMVGVSHPTVARAIRGAEKDARGNRE